MCGDAFHASMNRDPIEGGPCESERVWLASDMNRYRDDYDKLKERQKETCDVDLKDDRETCKVMEIDQADQPSPDPSSDVILIPLSSFPRPVRHVP